MGLPSVRRKRANIGQRQLAEEPDSEPGDPQRLVNPAGFDKARPPAARRVIIAANQAIENPKTRKKARPKRPGFLIFERLR
jgi:hypothetical protein